MQVAMDKQKDNNSSKSIIPESKESSESESESVIDDEIEENQENIKEPEHNYRRSKWAQLLNENPYRYIPYYDGGKKRKRPDYFHPILNPIIGAFQNLNRITGAHCRNIKMALDILTLPFSDYGKPIGRLQGGLWICSRLFRIVKPESDSDKKSMHHLKYLHFCKVESKKVTAHVKSLLIEMQGTYKEMKKYWLDYLLYRERLRQYRMKIVQDYYDEGRLNKETGLVKGWYGTGDCPSQDVVILENYEDWMNNSRRSKTARSNYLSAFGGPDANYLKRKDLNLNELGEISPDQNEVQVEQDEDEKPELPEQDIEDSNDNHVNESQPEVEQVINQNTYRLGKETSLYDFLWLPGDKCYVKKVEKGTSKTDWYNFNQFPWDVKKEILSKVFGSIIEMTKLAKWHLHLASKIMLKEGEEKHIDNSEPKTFVEECFITINKYHRLLKTLDRVRHSDPFRVSLLHVSLNEWYHVRDSMSHLRRFLKHSIKWINHHCELILPLSKCETNFEAMRHLARKYHIRFPTEVFSNSFFKSPKFQRARFSMTRENEETFYSRVTVDNWLNLSLRNQLQQICVGDNGARSVKPIRNRLFIDDLYWKSIRLGPLYQYLFQQHYLGNAAIQIYGTKNRTELINFERIERIEEIVDAGVDINLDTMGFYFNVPQDSKVVKVMLNQETSNLYDLKIPSPCLKNTILPKQRTVNDAVTFPYLMENRTQTEINMPDMHIHTVGNL